SGYWGNAHFSEETAHEIVRTAFDRGINHFDTGHNYSNFNAEPRLGRVLGDLLSTNDRSKLVISSKAGTTLARASIAPTSRGRAKDFSPNWIEESCRRSIDNLRCQYLDIFYLHGIEYTEITDDLLARLERMRRDGMFQYLGINTHREIDMRWMTERADSFDVALIDYNLLQLDREPIITQLHQSGIGVIAGTVLAQGHLVKGKIGSLRSRADAWYLLRALLKGSGRRLLRSSGAMRNALWSCPVSVDTWKLGRGGLKLSLLQSPLELRR
ncbi:MAG: aldo/keto reductase, partial [Coriobacteriia bacterium]